MFNTETDYLDEKSILNQMVKYDNLVEKFYDIVRKYQSAVSEISTYIDEVDDSIRAEFLIIQNEMNNKLKGICSLMCNSKDKILTDVIKYKSEVINLNRENNEIIEQIQKLKEQIRVMELKIGKDNPNFIFNYTK
jgi:hypothetical protein